MIADGFTHGMMVSSLSFAGWIALICTEADGGLMARGGALMVHSSSPLARVRYVAGTGDNGVAMVLCSQLFCDVTPGSPSDIGLLAGDTGVSNTTLGDVGSELLSGMVKGDMSSYKGAGTPSLTGVMSSNIGYTVDV